MKPILTLSFVLISALAFSQGLGNNLHRKSHNSASQDTSQFVNMFDAAAYHISEVKIYGAGSLLTNITTNSYGADADENSSASPAGSLGLNFSSDGLHLDLFYSYNSRTVTDINSLSSLGLALINPNTNGQSVSLDFNGDITEQWSLDLRAQLSDNFWTLDDSTQIDASPFVFKVGLEWRPFTFDLGTETLDVSLGAHYTHRSIMGDFSNSSQTIDGVEIPSRGYNGFDVELRILIKNLELYTSFNQNFTNDLVLPGFTGRQILFGINVSADFIQFGGEETED